MKKRLWKVYLFTFATLGSIVALFSIGLTQKTIENNEINQQANLLPPQQQDPTWISGFTATYLDDYKVEITFNVDTTDADYIATIGTVPAQDFFALLPNADDTSISDGTDTYPYNVVIEQDPADIDAAGIWTITQTLDYSYWGPGTYDIGFVVEEFGNWYQLGQVTLSQGSWVSAVEGNATTIPMSTVEINYEFTPSAETWDHVEFRFWKNADQTATTPVAETDAEGDLAHGGNDNGWVTLGKMSEGLQSTDSFIIGLDQYGEGGLTPDTNYTLQLAIDRVIGDTNNTTPQYITLAFDTSPGSKVIEDSVGFTGTSMGTQDPATAVGFNEAYLEYQVYYEPTDAGDVYYSLWLDPNGDGTIDANEEQDPLNEQIGWTIEENFAQNKPTNSGTTTHQVELGTPTAQNPALQTPLISGTDYVFRIGITHNNISETVPTSWEEFGFRTDGVTPISNVQITTSTIDEVVITFDAAPSEAQEGDETTIPGTPIAPAVQFRIYEADATGAEVSTVLDWTSVDPYLNTPIVSDGTYTLTIDNIGGTPLSQVLVPGTNYVVEITDQSLDFYDSVDSTGQIEHDFNMDGTAEPLLGDNVAFAYASFPEVTNFEVIGTSLSTARVAFDYKSAGHTGDLEFNVFQDSNGDGAMTSGEEVFTAWQVFGTAVSDSTPQSPKYEINLNDGTDTSTSDPAGEGDWQMSYTTPTPLIAGTEYNFVFKTGTHEFYGQDLNDDSVISADEEYSFTTEDSLRIGSLAQISTPDISLDFETDSASAEFVWTQETYTDTPIPEGATEVTTPSNINLDYQITTNTAYDNGVILDWTTIAADAVSGTSYSIDTNVDHPGGLEKGVQYYMQARWYHDANDNNTFDATESVGYITGTPFQIIIPDTSLPDVVKGDIELTASKAPTNRTSANGQISYKLYVELIDYAAIANTVEIRLYDNFGAQVASESVDITTQAASNSPFQQEYTGVFGNGQGSGDVSGLKQGSYYATATSKSKDGKYEYMITDGSDYTDFYANTTVPSNQVWLEPDTPASADGVTDPSLLVQPYAIISTVYENGGTDIASGTVEFGILGSTPGYSAVLDQAKSQVLLLTDNKELIPTGEVDAEGAAIFEYSLLTPSTEAAMIPGGEVFTFSLSIQDGSLVDAKDYQLNFKIYYDIINSTKAVYAEDQLFDMSLAFIIEEEITISPTYNEPSNDAWKIITTSMVAGGTILIGGMSFVWVRNRKRKEYSKKDEAEEA